MSRQGKGWESIRGLLFPLFSLKKTEGCASFYLLFSEKTGEKVRAYHDFSEGRGGEKKLLFSPQEVSP